MVLSSVISPVGICTRVCAEGKNEASPIVSCNDGNEANVWEEERSALISAEARSVLRYVRLEERLEGLAEAERGFSVEWGGGGQKDFHGYRQYVGKSRIPTPDGALSGLRTSLFRRLKLPRYINRMRLGRVFDLKRQEVAF